VIGGCEKRISGKEVTEKKPILWRNKIVLLYMSETTLSFQPVSSGNWHDLEQFFESRGSPHFRI